MSEMRCQGCNQLQYKYYLRGNQLIVEIKCYNCNQFNILKIQLNKLNKHEKNNK